MNESITYNLVYFLIGIIIGFLIIVVFLLTFQKNDKLMKNAEGGKNGEIPKDWNEMNMRANQN